MRISGYERNGKFSFRYMKDKDIKKVTKERYGKNRPVGSHFLLSFLRPKRYGIEMAAGHNYIHE